MSGEKKKAVSGDALARLQRQYELFFNAPQFINEAKHHSYQRHLAEIAKTPTDIIERFSQCVCLGLIPPPNMLAAIAENFWIYLNAEGEISLDEAFGRRKAQGVKHPLKQRLKDTERRRWYIHLWNLKREMKKSGKKDKAFVAAEETVKEFKLCITAETLEKEYRDSKLEKVLDSLPEFFMQSESGEK